jgi:hypothetical protein
MAFVFEKTKVSDSRLLSGVGELQYNGRAPLAVVPYSITVYMDNKDVVLFCIDAAPSGCLGIRRMKDEPYDPEVTT